MTKTYFKDIISYQQACEFVKRRSDFGHNVRFGKHEDGYRVYFSSGSIDIASAIEARVETRERRR